MFTLKDLQEKIEKRISDYIEFDVRELFEISDYITIYGGAVRDSIAALEIHDVDILCMPNSAYLLRSFLKKEYNYQTLDLFDQDTLNMYNGISLISEPWTLMNDNKKIIQIIRPTWKGGIKQNIGSAYQQEYRDLIKNVDISCCGVFIEKQDEKIILKEACKDAIIHCLSKTYIINEWSKLYNMNRISHRENKLISRGWSNYNDIIYPYRSNKIENRKKRKIKIYTLEFKPEYDYKIWTEDEYLNRVAPKNDKRLGWPF